MTTYSIVEAPADSTVGYQPYGAIADLWLCKAHEVIVSGPAETGKTRGALEKLNLLLWKYPGAQAVMIRKQYVDMPGSCIQTWEKKVLGDTLSDDGPITKYGGEKPQFYDYPNGSRLWVGGLDKPGKTLSSERDFAYINQAEELELDDWEIITTRVTGRAGNAPYSQVFGDCNPAGRMHWILERDREGKLKLFNSRHEDNPTLYDPVTGELTEQGRVTLAILDDLTGVRFSRLREGKWVSAEGQIYGYDPATHLIDPFQIPARWRRFRCIDFGLVHPFVCGWWAMDEEGRLYLYRQIYMTGRTVTTHAADINRLTLGVTMEEWQALGNEKAKKLVFAVNRRDVGLIAHLLGVPDKQVSVFMSRVERIEQTICDHDAEDRKTLAENGIPNIGAKKDVLQGIGKVQDRLKIQEDGKPRLFIFKNSLVEVDQSLQMAHKPYAVEQEFDGYIWGNSSKKDEPVKEDDHGMDQTRYMVMYFDAGDKKKKVRAVRGQSRIL